MREKREGGRGETISLAQVAIAKGLYSEFTLVTSVFHLSLRKLTTCFSDQHRSIFISC